MVGSCVYLQALPLTSTDGFESRPPWMVGTAQLLTPDDPSPFYELAPIPPGEMQFAVDTPCFRSAAHLMASSASHCSSAACVAVMPLLFQVVAVIRLHSQQLELWMNTCRSNWIRHTGPVFSWPRALLL